jgi:hypothetical protein
MAVHLGGEILRRTGSRLRGQLLQSRLHFRGVQPRIDAGIEPAAMYPTQAVIHIAGNALLLAHE